MTHESSRPGSPQPAAVQVITPRQADLGDGSDLEVRRILPSRKRSLIGGWCFLDHFGPEPTAETGGMQVPAHPHTALQTVTWLFSGEIEHRDSLGTRAYVRLGQLNLMTAGRGINHTEYSTPETEILHGVQLWTAMPAATRHVDPHFEHYEPEPLDVDGHRVSVFIGELCGDASPAKVYSPMVGAEIVMGAQELVLDVRADFEFGVMPDGGDLIVDGEPVGDGDLAYLEPGATELRLQVSATTEEGRPVRVILIGGEPLGEQIVMWWNFIAPSHEEVVAARANWQAAIGQPDDEGLPVGLSEGQGHDDPGQFGPLTEPTHGDPPIPAPSLPRVRLRSRG